MHREPDARSTAPVDAQQDTAGEGGWLQRWSQRKRRADLPDASPEDEASEQPVASGTSGDPRQEAQADAAEIPALPPIESLDEHSDYRAFMSDKVSEDLRLQALRKLFSLPQFNVRDDLNDYDEDFASFKPLGDIVPHDLARSLDRALKRAADMGGPDGVPAAPDARQAGEQPPRVAGTDKPAVDGGTQQYASRGDEASPERRHTGVDRVSDDDTVPDGC